MNNSGDIPTHQGQPYTLQHIVPTSDGGYIAVGTIINNMTGVLESHYWIVKLDSLGCLMPDCGSLNFLTDTQEAAWLQGVSILIYPNPADQAVTVALPEDFPIGMDLSIRLISSTGSQLAGQAISQRETILALNGFPVGTYYAVISRGNEILVSKKIAVVR